MAYRSRDSCTDGTPTPKIQVLINSRYRNKDCDSNDRDANNNHEAGLGILLTEK